jgi:hypothetical protein
VLTNALPEHRVDKAGERLTVRPFHKLDGFVDHMVLPLLHEEDLVKADPEQVMDIGPYRLAEEVAEHPVEVTLLADDAGYDLVEEGAMDLRHRFP